jgi:cell shape-determining protein MreD
MGFAVAHINLLALIWLTYLGVFLPAWASSFNQALGAQPDVLPALMVYCGLKCSLPVLSVVALLGGFWRDSLSANPMGTVVLPLFLTGWIIHWKREVILQEQVYAQFVLGFVAGAVAPLMSLFVLYGVGEKPLLGWASLWQWLVLALSAGLAAPVVFWFLNVTDRLLAFKRLPESSFRPDREMKRGRFQR